MRKAGRIVVLFLLGALSTAFLAVVTALMAAVSLAATALVVPGTGTPKANIVTNYMENAADRYIAPFSDPSCTSTNGCTLTGIDYPASFFPLVIFPGWCEPGRCETWNTSVEEGVDGLYTALQNVTDPDGASLFGYSQGGAVVSNTLRRLEGDPLLDKVSSVVLIGNAYNPDGGLFTRLGFLPTIPFLDITFGPATPVDIPELAGKITGIGFEFDPVMYAPLYWGNPLAMLNALAALDNVHGFYLTPNGNGPTDSIAYGYTEEELEDILATDCPGAYCRVDTAGNKYYMIPAKSLPMMDLIMSVVPAPLAPIVKPIVDLVSPAAEVLINLGYDWSGDPGQTRFLSILPFSPTTNWIQVGVDLVEAAGEGIENAFGGGGSVMIAPPDENLSTLAATASESAETGDSEPVQTLTAVQDDDATETQETEDVEDETAVDDNDAKTTDEDDVTTDDETTTDEDETATTDEDDATKADEDDATTDETADETAVDDTDDTTKDDKQDEADSNDSDNDTGQAAA